MRPYRREIACGACIAVRARVKRVAAVLVLVSAFVACGTEEWNRNQLAASNPYGGETDPTEPADDDDPVDATGDATTSGDAAVDGRSDARPADARTDARDATSG